MFTFYRNIKTEFKMEKYLSCNSTYHVNLLCRFRVSNHKLPVEKGRYHGIVRYQRYCTLCNKNKLGDEYHLLLKCDN